eukprot:18559-Heterococcus_DN1.PRE.1
MSYDQKMHPHMYIDSECCATSFNRFKCRMQDTRSIAANTQRAHCIRVVDCKSCFALPATVVTAAYISALILLPDADLLRSVAA